MSTKNNLTQKGLILVVQGVVNEVLGTPFVIEISRLSNEPMTLPKRTVVVQSFALPTVMGSPLEEPINAVQLYKNEEPEKKRMEETTRHYAIAM